MPFDLKKKREDGARDPWAQAPQPGSVWSGAPAPAPAPQAAIPHAAGMPGIAERGISDPSLPSIGGASAEQARMRDRALAQLELEERFKIVGGDAVGARQPNEVTPEEYEKLCNLFSDIRTGSSNIALDSSGMDPAKAEAFKSGTMDDIASMLQTPGGRTLLEQLATATAADGTARKTTISESNGLAEDMWGHFAPTYWEGGSDAQIFTKGVGANARVAHHPGESGDLTGNFNTPDHSDAILYYHLLRAKELVSGTAHHEKDSPRPHEGVLNQEKWDRSVGNFATSVVGGDELSLSRYRDQRRLLGAR